MVRELDNKVAIVTGASQGIGRAIAQRMAVEGAHVIVADCNPKTGLSTVEALQGHAMFCCTDVASATDVHNLVHTVIRVFGRIDVLVNNAGLFQREPTEQLTEEKWNEVLDVDLTGTFRCCQAAGHAMIKQKSGRIINISSINGLVAFPERLAYNVSKAGVIALTKALAVEWAKYDITINTIAPGYVCTEATAEHLAHGWFDEASILHRTPLGHWIDMDDIAQAAVFLASDRAANITGVVLPVDGGWVAYGYL